MRLLRFVPALVWAALIFAVSAQSKLPTPPLTFEGIDKVLHALVFGVQCALLVLADPVARGRRVWLWVGVTGLYGASDELHQAFVPGRSPDALDLLADLAGAVAAAVLLARTRRA